MGDPAYTVCCALGAFLSLITLPSHWQARSASTLIYLGWISVGCLVAFTNSLVWAGNIEDKAPIWCDISIRFTVALNTGITTAGLCIQRRLYRIASMKEVASTESSRRKELIINLVLGVGIPLLMIPLYYVVQGVRYLIVEDIGCWPGIYPTMLAEPIYHIWPVLASSVAFVYAGLTIQAFFKMRRQFSMVLSESGTELNLSRFFRLMALSATEMCGSLPLSLYFLITDIQEKMAFPWASWGEIHQNTRGVEVVTQTLLREVPGLREGYEISKWAIPACAFSFFVWFGFSEEAIRQHKSIFWKTVEPLGFKRPDPESIDQNISWTKRLASGISTPSTHERSTHESLNQSELTITQPSPIPLADSDNKSQVLIGNMPRLDQTGDQEPRVVGDIERGDKVRWIIN